MANAKGYDDSPPRNGVILFYTVLAVVVLIGVDFLLDSYFAKVMDTEIHDKVLTVGLDKAIETRAQEAQELEKLGIDNAKRAIAQNGRGASAVIAPTSGANQPASPGWSQLPRGKAAATTPPAAEAAQPTGAANASPQPANPNAQQKDPAPTGTGAPSPSRSPVAPAGRPGQTAGDAK